MQANKQGSIYKSLTITRNGESTSNTILKTEFLKKTENYTCLVRDFVTNITPPLNDSSEVAFQIFIRGTGVQGTADVAFPAHWNITDTQFTPTPYHSTIEFLRQAQQFFHKFSFLVRMIGAAVLPARLTANERVDGYPFVRTNYVGALVPVNRGWDVLGNDRIVHCRMLSDGVFEVNMTPDFTNNFYITVGTETRRLLGLKENIFIVELANGQLGEDEPLLAGALFNPLVNNVIQQPTRIKSKYALHQLDERLSIDVIGTFPISNKIISVDGGEEHEYLLARFPLNDYNKFTTIIEGTEDRITDFVMVLEEVNVGLEDLTRNSPASSAIYMLPGTIQQINFRLRTRYYSDGQVKSERTKMGNGFWTLTLLFGKKV